MQEESAQQAAPQQALQQTEAGKASEATQDRAGPKSKDCVDRPTLTAPHTHDSKHPRPVQVGAPTFHGENIEGESQVKAWLPITPPDDRRFSDLVEFFWQGATALKRPRPLSHSPTEPEDSEIESESWAAKSFTLPLRDQVKGV